jgi:ribonuclease III
MDTTPLAPDEAALIRAAEARLGLHFQQPTLLLEALTHRSHLNEQTGRPTPSNERLEFLGDAALGFVVARYLYRRFPDLSEGLLTAHRAGLIRSATLAAWARELDLAAVLRLGQGELAAGPVRDSILADAFESILGAILLDQGLPAVEEFLLPIVERHGDTAMRRAATQNYKGLLQELAQEREHLTPLYRTVAMSGPDHDRTFTVEVVVGTRVLGLGTGRSKQEAQQAAAEHGLRHYLASAEGEEEAWATRTTS